MKAHQAERWEVVKDVDDECSDREWEDMKVVVKKEVVKQVTMKEEVVEECVVVMEEEKVVSLVVVVVDTRWEESQWRQNQVKKVNKLIRGVSIREERMRLIEGNIMGNPNEMSNWIPTTISLTLRVITKEDTLDWLCR
jgi:hypothetical protein